MKMIQGAFSRALLKMLRTIRGPSPSHLKVSWREAIVLLNELTGDHLNEVGGGGVGDGLG